MGIETDPAALGAMAERVAAAIRECRNPDSCTAGAFTELGVSLDAVLRTLDLVAAVAREDRGKPHQRLLDPRWLAAHFDVWTWQPDVRSAARRNVVANEREIRLTHYLVYQLDGSPVRTDTFDTALYATPADGDTPWRACPRPEIYAGAFEPGGEAAGLLEPLVWLTEEGVNHALMQGTVEVRLPNGRTQRYNVHDNNGIPWDPATPTGSAQGRYWTFRAVDEIRGVEGVSLEPWVSVAGDIHNVGFGKLVALTAPDAAGAPTIRLAVLADTGGAFEPNLFQLDWLAGSFRSHTAYTAHVAHLPRRVAASVLVAR